jgi:hypothetical protein
MKTKAHTRYRLANGEIVPGTTTITGLLAKNALIKWSNDLGLKGISVGSYVDDKAMIGTLAHEMILAHLSKREPETEDYSKNQIDAAENSFLSYLEWEKQHLVTPILTEFQAVSETHKYGGAFDFYGSIDDTLEVVDFKTGSGIYDEMWLQVAAYGQLIKEPIRRYRILNIPRTEDESFKEEVKTDLSLHFEGFLKLLDFYYINKQIKKG